MKAQDWLHDCSTAELASKEEHAQDRLKEPVSANATFVFVFELSIAALAWLLALAALSIVRLSCCGSLKDAVIASQAAVFNSIRQQPGLDVVAPRIDALAAQQAQQVAATEARLQRLEAALSVSSSSNSGDCSSSSSISDPSLQLQKRARSSSHLAQALDEDEVLDEIFSFVGRKEWLYAGGVCRRWRGRYLSMCYKARASTEEHAFQTSRESSFVTAARFSMALDNGLQMPDQLQAGNFFQGLSRLSKEPVEVLTLARVHGAAWHSRLWSNAAFRGHFELLKWLRKSRCPWIPLCVAMNAIRSTHGQYRLILPWLFSIVDEWSQADKNTLLAEAGMLNDLEAAELLLSEGAEWPDSFAGQRQRLGGRMVHSCWRYAAVAWAVSKGYCWEGWRCQDLAPELFTTDDDREDAADLFKWAHRSGCPCTC
jgi:hypothetical protein